MKKKKEKTREMVQYLKPPHPRIVASDSALMFFLLKYQMGHPTSGSLKRIAFLSSESKHVMVTKIPEGLNDILYPFG
jgi:hypothetical protein